MLQMKNKRGNGDLLQKLGRMLLSTGSDFTRVKAYDTHVGFVGAGSVYLAKKELWNSTTVSFQRSIVTGAVESGQWICVWVKDTGNIYRFDPEVILMKGWNNGRGEEEMINIDVLYSKQVGLLIQPKLDKPLNLSLDIIT